MGSQARVGDQLRKRLREERERRRWSQSVVSQALTDRGIDSIYPSTIAKIESGDRAVHPDELSAFADLFNISTDALLGRPAENADAVWAIGKLTSTAQKTASDVRALHDRVEADLDDVRYHSKGRDIADDVMEQAGEALAQLRSTMLTLNELANQFPLPR